MIKKISAALLAGVMVFSLSACSLGSIWHKTPKGKVFKTSVAQNLSSLDFADNIDDEASTAATYLAGFLWRKYPTEDGKGYTWLADLADGDPVQIDETNWQINLRRDAVWDDGTAINADTWIFTFKTMFDPSLKQRMSTYLADNIITISNAYEYSVQGTEEHPDAVSFDDVGIKKLDEYSIQITTAEANTADEVREHFSQSCCTPLNEALWTECLSEDGLSTTYGTDKDKYISSGPYALAEWDPEQGFIFTKKDDHWLSGYFNYDAVEVYIIPDMADRVDKFRNGELDELVPDKASLDTFIDDERLHSYGSTIVGCLDINCKNPENPICASVNYRKAIYHSINREEAASTAFGHMEPVGTYVNDLAGDASESGLTYRESDYGKAVTEQVEKDGPYGFNASLALDYLNKAIEECGVKEDQLPITVKFAVDEEDEEWSAFADYLAKQWDEIFAGKMKIEIVPYSGITASDFKNGRDERWDLATNEKGREISRKYPYACYYYFLAKYNSSPNNYHPAEFDAQYAQCEAIKDLDYDAVLEATQKLEQIDLQYVVECPVFQTRNYMLFSDHLKLPVSEYIDDFGWGQEYGDIDTNGQ